MNNIFYIEEALDKDPLAATLYSSVPGLTEPEPVASGFLTQIPSPDITNCWTDNSTLLSMIVQAVSSVVRAADSEIEGAIGSVGSAAYGTVNNVGSEESNKHDVNSTAKYMKYKGTDIKFGNIEFKIPLIVDQFGKDIKSAADRILSFMCSDYVNNRSGSGSIMPPNGYRTPVSYDITPNFPGMFTIKHKRFWLYYLLPAKIQVRLSPLTIQYSNVPSYINIAIEFEIGKYTTIDMVKDLYHK